MNLGEGEKPNPTNQGKENQWLWELVLIYSNGRGNPSWALTAGKGHPCTSTGNLLLGHPSLSAGLS